MRPSRRGLVLLTILTVLTTMISFEPWHPYPLPNTATPPATLRSAPVIQRSVRPASVPRAAAGRNGPQTNASAAPTPRNAAATAAARQAARQRYLDQVYLLGKLIHSEARGESYVGQVAVGAVVMNRIDSPFFPNSMAGVIFQPGAFDAVIDGQFDLAPDQEAVDAARDAIGGWDPTGGAIYYYNPAKTTSNWIWSRPVVLVIGEHYFAR